jgi:hypothetical protein
MKISERSASQPAPAEGAQDADPNDGRYGQAMQRYIGAIAGGPHHSQMAATAEGGRHDPKRRPNRVRGTEPWSAT